MVDQYKNSATSPATGFAAVSLDTDYEPRPKGIYVGGTGNLILQDPAGNAVTFTNVQAGTILAVRPRQVVSVGTTATGIVVLL